MRESSIYMSEKFEFRESEEDGGRIGAEEKRKKPQKKSKKIKKRT